MTESPAFGPFVEAMRTLQDLAVSVDASDDILVAATAQVTALAELLGPSQVPKGQGPAGRSPHLPGRGSLLLPAWTIQESGPQGVRATGILRRYHLDGHGSGAHGGVVGLLFDEYFGTVMHAANQTMCQTAYLHVNYRKLTPLDVPLTLEGHVDRVEGRKTYVTARLTDPDGTLLADGEGLMIAMRTA